jgi:LmbE family N-acetylglucosaminyl deacetylase
LTDKRRLLAVFAHPDDESFGPGGTLAHYANLGVEVHLICATRGEAGNIPEALKGKEDSVAELREAELRCAAYQLGLERVHFLDYRDSGMAGSPDNQHPNSLAKAPTDEIADKVTQFIRQIKPHVVITFDPQGGYFHPDHIATHEATVIAFNAAGDSDQFPGELPPHQPQKLYFTIFPVKLLRAALRLTQLFGRDPTKWGRNNDIDLMKITEKTYPVHARINTASVAKVKQRAAECHASQLDGGPRRRGLIGLIFRVVDRQENFMRAYPPTPEGIREDDLFSGVKVGAK